MPPLVFFGSSQFSVVVLDRLLSKSCKIAAVVTTPDQPSGRHLKLSPNPIKLFAQKNNIPVVVTMNDLMTTYDNSMTPPIGLVAAYGRIIPRQILDKFNDRIFNIHPSLLPKYRGPSPLQKQILDEVSETGVTVIQLDEKMDHGPVVAVAKDKISPSDTWLTLGNRLFEKGTDLFLSLNIKHLTLNPQDEAQATYTKKLTRQDGFLPWDEFIKYDYDKLFRAYYPWPGVWSIDPKNRRVKLVSFHPVMLQFAGQKPTPIPISP